MARITSGAIQYGVPTNVFAGHATDAEPKSATETNTNRLFQLLLIELIITTLHFWWGYAVVLLHDAHAGVIAKL